MRGLLIPFGLLLLLAGSLVGLAAGCGEDAPARPAPTAAPGASEPQAETAEASRAEATGASGASGEAPGQAPENGSEARARTERPPPLDAAARQRLRAALRAGRAAFHTGDQAGARRHFDEALRLAPRDPQIHCEAGFISIPPAIDQDGEVEDREEDEEGESLTPEQYEELDDYASLHLRHGLALFGGSDEVVEPLRVPLAMCLYNQGLLHERDEMFEEAEGFYRRSLSLRENGTVRRHLTTVVNADRERDDPIMASGAEELARILNEEARRDETLLGERCGEVSSAELVRAFPAVEGRPEAAWLLRTCGDELTETHSYWMAIREGEGFRLFFVHSLMVDNTDHGSSVEGSWRPGGARVLGSGVVQFDFVSTTELRIDGYVEPPAGAQEEEGFDYYSVDRGTRRSALLCRLGAPPRCATLDLAGTSMSESVVEAAPEELPAWVRGYTSPRREGSWETALEVELPGRGLRVTMRDGSPPEEEHHRLPIGRWLSLDEALRLLGERS